MNAVSAIVSVEEYLHTVYRPDCDYVDGVVEDRNVGEKDHNKVQRAVLVYLHLRQGEFGIFVIQEQRLRLGPSRYRVPDVCVVWGPEPDEQVLTQPPFLCIEILSPEDRMGRMQERIADSLAFGVHYVWVIDPQTRRAWIYTADSIHEVRDGILRTQSPAIEVPLAT